MSAFRECAALAYFDSEWSYGSRSYLLKSKNGGSGKIVPRLFVSMLVIRLVVVVTVVVVLMVFWSL